MFSISSVRVFAFLLVTHFICGQAFSDDLIGVDWGGDAPTNWNVGTVGDNTQTLLDLIDESGAATGINLAFDGAAFFDTNFVRGFDNVNAAQIPSHSNSLGNIGGGLGDADVIAFTYSGLMANTDYEVYLFGGNTFIDTIHDVTGAVNFTQDLTSDDTGDLWVNGSVGSNADLSDFAVIATSDGKGELSFSVTGTGNMSEIGTGVIVAGLAIRLSSPTPVLGDVNCDGEFNFLDIAPFIDALANETDNPKADINLDGAVNFSDVGPFIDLLSGS